MPATVALVRAYAAFAALALLASGCGSKPAPRAQAPVKLYVDAPSDGATVEDDKVEVRGRVWPSTAKVLVGGEEVDSHSGEFSATVDLSPGANVVDVVAGADQRPAAMAAVRVTRIVPIRIPDVSGESPDSAVKKLEALGLKTETHQQGGLFDNLLPGDETVCITDPLPGASVRPGTTVTITYAKIC
jgi:PASTA domain-containing protein/glucodextranase-like protein